jgi:hypothetical protein
MDTLADNIIVALQTWNDSLTTPQNEPIEINLEIERKEEEDVVITALGKFFKNFDTNDLLTETISIAVQIQENEKLNTEKKEIEKNLLGQIISLSEVISDDQRYSDKFEEFEELEDNEKNNLLVQTISIVDAIKEDGKYDGEEFEDEKVEDDENDSEEIPEELEYPEEPNLLEDILKPKTPTKPSPPASEPETTNTEVSLKKWTKGLEYPAKKVQKI